MNLSDQEKEYLRVLRSTERMYYRLRYVFLTLGVTCIVVGVGGYLYLLASQDRVAFEGFGNHPVFYLLCIAGGFGIGTAIRGWKGNPAHRLLIKVVEEMR